MINCLFSLLSSCNFSRKMRYMYGSVHHSIECCMRASIIPQTGNQWLTLRVNALIKHTHGSRSLTTTTVSLFCPHWKRERRKIKRYVSVIRWDEESEENDWCRQLEATQLWSNVNRSWFRCLLFVVWVSHVLTCTHDEGKNNVFYVAPTMTDIFTFF